VGNLDKKELIKKAAQTLFFQYGWEKVSIGEICQQANISRVTFYKHFTNKKELLKQLFTEQKEEMWQAFNDLLENAKSLDLLIQRIFQLQKHAMQTLYSQEMVYDLQHHKDEELQAFFAEMEQEKYQFMHYFFTTLQQKSIIRDDFPVLLIEIFIRKIDELKTDPALLQCYQGKDQQFLKDILSLLMYGIAAKA